MSRLLSTLKRHRLEIALCAALTAVAAATFASTAGFEFVAWDDDIEITRNTNIRGLGLANLKWMFTDVGSTLRYVPLSWLTWASVHAMAGLDPAAFHLLNLVLHLANTVLVFWLIRALLLLPENGGKQGHATDSSAIRGAGDAGATPPGHGLPPPPRGTVEARAVRAPTERRDGPAAISLIAAVAALLWAIHPLRGEVVAWATHARYAQSLVFFLAALILYMRAARRSPAPALRDPAYWLAVAAGAASALSYATGTVLVLVLIVLDVSPLRRFLFVGGSPSLRRRTSILHIGAVLLEKAPFLAAPALVAAITLWGRLNARGIWEAPASIEAFGVLARTMQAFYIWAYYLWRPFVPFGLSPVYTRLVHFDALAPPFLASALVVVAVTALAVLARRRHPALVALWVCHLAVLVPVLGLTEHPHYASDRYAYLQGILWSIAAAAGLRAVMRRRMRALPAVCAVVLVLSAGLAVLAHRQTLIWRDSITLFESIISRLGDDPYTEDIYWRLGFARITRGAAGDDEVGAALLIRHAAPARALEGAGRLLLERQRPEAAASLLARAAAQGGAASTYTALGVALLRMQRPGDAAGALSRALAIEPGSLIALEYLGIAHMAEGKIDQAIGELAELVRRDPKNSGARQRLDAARAARSEVIRPP